jgi:hypothetical protein
MTRAGHDENGDVLDERAIEHLTTSQRVAVRAITALHPDDVRFAVEWLDERSRHGRARDGEGEAND